MNNKLVILDRDGVINHDRVDYITQFNDWKIYDGVAEAISNISKAGYKVAIASNQSALGRKITTLETINQIHQKLSSLVENLGGKINYIAYCSHHPDENCSCRKPNDGLFLEISKKLNISLEGGYMVGDSERDLIPALKHKMKPVLVTTGKGAKTLETMQLRNVLVIKNLVEFSQYLLDQK